MTDPSAPFRFNWQDKYNSSDTFLKWLLPTVLAGVDRETMDALSESTDLWTEVELGVTVNGVEVDARHFIESLEKNLTRMSNKAARHLVHGHLSLSLLIEDVAQLELNLRNHIRVWARQHGIDIDEHDD